jgi:hypothetical protein
MVSKSSRLFCQKNLTIRLASKDGQPVATILTLYYRNGLIYKYGGSDARFNNLGGMPLLFRKAIQEAKQAAAQEFDLGRSERDNPGFVRFKDRLGAAGLKVTYFRLESTRFQGLSKGLYFRVASHAFTRMPDALAQMADRVLYRHMG